MTSGLADEARGATFVGRRSLPRVREKTLSKINGDVAEWLKATVC
jgi:hypothetical protein